MGRIPGRFARVEPRRRVRDLVLGLLSDLPRKNCWSIAEWAGETSPDGMQHLLGRARWDADRVRDDVREYVLEHLREEDAVLVVDETGDVKKGTHTVAVQRQYTGTAGRIENAQVAVYLVYAGGRGHAAVDRELYIPRSWTCDADRCRAAGLGEDTVFAPKPELAARMIGRFLDAGHRVDWVAGDEVYGGNPKLRSALEERGAGYVLAVACSAEVTTGAGKFRADALAAKVPRRAWQKLSAGAGAKGHRFYDWAVIDLAEPRPGSHRLLVRRNRTTGELAYYRCFSPAPAPWPHWSASPGRDGGWRRPSRPEKAWPDWTSTNSAASPRGLAGSPWPCSPTPSSPSSADEHTCHPAPDGLISLTCNEIQRLFTMLVVQPVHDVAHRLRWSAWRRRHQARAQASHYRRQAANQT